MNLFLPFSQLLLLLLIFYLELRNIAVFAACPCSVSLMLEQFFLRFLAGDVQCGKNYQQSAYSVIKDFSTGKACVC